DGLKRRDGAIVSVRLAPKDAPETVLPGMSQMTELEKAQTQGQINAGTHQQNHERRAPDNPVEPAVGGSDELQHSDSLLVCFSRASVAREYTSRNHPLTETPCPRSSMISDCCAMPSR